MALPRLSKEQHCEEFGVNFMSDHLSDCVHHGTLLTPWVRGSSLVGVPWWHALSLNRISLEVLMNLRLRTSDPDSAGDRKSG